MDAGNADRSRFKHPPRKERIILADNADSTIVQVRDLCKRFDGFTAVDGISFEVDRGEILGILGPNGAGKTTTVQLLLGLITPTSGDIRIFGLELGRHRQEIAQRVNFSSAYVSLPANLTVRENLQVFARIYGVRRPAARIAELLEAVNLTAETNKLVGQLSTGQQVRLNLCKALLNDPELLFLDEPTSSLDPDVADQMRRMLLDIRREKGLTVIFTSHNMAEMEEVCDRVLFLQRGSIIASGRPDEVVSLYNGRSLEEVFLHIARQGREGGAKS